MYINYNDKLANLKAEIDMNMANQYSTCRRFSKYCFGDLVTIGYAQKLAEGTGRYTQQECWQYTVRSKSY